MKNRHKKHTIVLLGILSLMVITGCSKEDIYLHYALKAAGENKTELKAVLRHYRTEDPDKEKLRAAKYLIANMPAHYSYRDTAAINSYYRKALEILGTGPSPDWQRDTLNQISGYYYWGLSEDTISDVKVIKADYLIYNIDHAFNQWRTRPWAQHLSFEEFRDWILPYKVTELQSFDLWRDILSSYYSDSLSKVQPTDYERNTIYGAIEIARNEIQSNQYSIGHRVIWDPSDIIPLRSADTWKRMTYGSCMEYVIMGTAVFRSLAMPAAIDMVPIWGRNSAGHCWYTFLDDRGREQVTINSLIMPAGQQFYPYERIPKVWRSSYTINRDLYEYRNRAKYVYPFDLCRVDVTDRYNLTSDLEIETKPETVKCLVDKKYVYIAMVVNSFGPEWFVLDYGKLKKGKACFNKMGRNMLYIVLGFDGEDLIPISHPFILHKDGKIEYVGDEDTQQTVSRDLRRKYYESYNVVDMRRRILGGKFQCSDSPDFKDAVTLYTIETTEIPYLIELNAERSYRYWRYFAPNGSWGSISELSFHDADGNKMFGIGIANPEAGQDAIDRAYDGNLLSNFEINQPDGNWVGMDMGKPINVTYASVSPRSDDNDICPGDEYELLYYDGEDWNSYGYQVGKGNSLHYDVIPLNTLLWMRDYTRGNNERPFIIRENGAIEWW